MGETKVELPGVSPSSSSIGAISPSGSRCSQGGDGTDSSAGPVPGDHGESPQVLETPASLDCRWLQLEPEVTGGLGCMAGWGVGAVAAAGAGEAVRGGGARRREAGARVTG
jgi:hypothetical protein